MKLSEAFKEAQKEFPNSADYFVILYGLMGKNELYDGIHITMEDEGHGEFMEVLLELYDETD